MNKKLLAGLMSVVMLAGSGATVGAHEVGKSKVSNNSVVRFVKNHKKIIAGILVVGAGAGVGYYKREEVKNGFNIAKDKIKEMKLTPLKERFNKVKSWIKSKLAENKVTSETSTDTKVVVNDLNQETKNQVEVQEKEVKAEAESVNDVIESGTEA